MWSYYGSKTTIAKHYPKPIHDKIIEPFAGAAKYSLLHFEKDVLLVDKYEVIIRIWKWLQKCSEKDIRSLPHFVEPGQSIESMKLDCEEQEWLMGFLVGYGMQIPRKTASKTKLKERPNKVNHNLKSIEKNLYKIRHWNFFCGDYNEIENELSTWFIDPPYQFGGHTYVHGNSNIDYEQLRKYCLSRNGQIIVCENTKADWMEFLPMTKHKGISENKHHEAIWSNEPTIFNNVQTSLFNG